MNAITAADDLVEFLENHPSFVARVHSIFPHAVNLLVLEDALVTLTNQDDITPMGLKVDCDTSFAEFMQAGDEIVLDIDRFTAANDLITVNLRNAEVWETRSMLILDALPAETVSQTRFRLMRWLEKQSAQGLLPLLPRLTRQAVSSKPANDNLYSRYIADDLEAFTKAINSSDWERALPLADRLIGFGMGSTPACDDFLAAYMVVLRIANELDPGRFPWIREFNDIIASKANKRTTLISANMLRHASEGRVSLNQQQLLQACLFKSDKDLILLAEKVLRHGASSGGDFLLGLVCALEWYQNAITEISKEGDKTWVEYKRLQPVPTL